jgi:hypothetical protein
MQDSDVSGALWREAAASRTPLSQDAGALGRLIKQDHDPAEISYYEAVSDPDAQSLDDAQRSYAGQYRRRVRRLQERHKHTSP